MSVTYQQYISLACQQALAGQNPLTSNILDIELTAETLVPTVFKEVAMRYAADPDKRSLLRRTHTLAVTTGVASLPATVLTQGKAGATISDPADDTVAQNQTMIWYWNDFVAPRSGLLSQIPQWLIQDDNFYYLEANATYDPAAGFTGDIELTISSVPVIPATAATTLDVPEDALPDFITALALALRSPMKAVA